MKEKMLFALIMSGCMAFTMSGVMTFLNIGLIPDFFTKWMNGFLIAYAIAFPLVITISPLIRKLVHVR